MIRFQGRLETPSASLYLLKLSKHFRHKIEVEFDPQRARAEFPFGLCLMEADEHSLRFDCEVPDARAEASMKGVIDDHLLRFTRNPELVVRWQP